MSESNPENSGIPPVERVRQEVDRWLEVVRNTGERTLESLGITGGNRTSNLPVDMIELPNEIVVQVDLPGVSAETVDVSLAGNMLTITATRQRQEFTGDARVHVRERFAGQYQRAIPLPAAVNDEGVKAETRDGLLTITLKKAVPGPGRSIPVSRGNGGTV
ncbi:MULTISPECIES: Hsp20/alpha crystallin family protein [unclassified Schlesneria]|uniref:Hsp20/alpha crystallin family protein n=1 Tax=Schlesneria TaxID=656899 RepID=UPI00359FF558